MHPTALPLAAELMIGALALGGGAVAVLGALGLARWRDPLARLHAPTLVTTLGIGGAVAASAMGASLQAGAPRLHDLLVGAAVAFTAPLGTHLLAKALIARGQVPAPIDTQARPPAAAGRPSVDLRPR
jgi:multicomponent K+:H+ antiporter subunit G